MRRARGGNYTRASGRIAKLSWVVAPQATVTMAGSLRAPARMPSLPQVHYPSGSRPPLRTVTEFLFGKVSLPCCNDARRVQKEVGAIFR